MLSRIILKSKITFPGQHHYGVVLLYIRKRVKYFPPPPSDHLRRPEKRVYLTNENEMLIEFLLQLSFKKCLNL